MRLRPGRDKSLRERHPWVFSGAIARVDGDPASGETVDICRDDGAFVARAAYSPSSQIRARVWTFDAGEVVDDAFFARRVGRSVAARAPMRDPLHTACRLIHGEADGLPGVVADATATRSCSSSPPPVPIAGATRSPMRWCRRPAPHASTSVPTRRCARSKGCRRARDSCGAHCRPRFCSTRTASRYRADVVAGQKTGFYLDQRENRATVRALAAEREALNVFCYTGGFTLAALAGGARRVVSIDSSAAALALARENLARNAQLPADRAEWIESDAFAELRKLRDRAASFDLIVLDPPKFAPTAAHAERAARAYKDVNLLALKLLRPGGLLATFSCSGGIDASLFRKIVAGAALDAGADAAVIGRFGAFADHPVALAFPEGEYLKGLLIRKTG